MAVPMFGWGVIILAGLVALAITVLAIALNESTRVVGLALGLMLVVGAGVVATFVYFGTAQAVPSPATTPPNMQPVQPLPAEKPLEAVPDARPPATSNLPIVNSIAVASTEHTVPVEAPTPTSLLKPEWVDQPGRLQGTIYRTSVKSGLFVTRAECDKAIAPKLRATVMSYVDDVLGVDAAHEVQLDADLMKRLRTNDYLETVTSSSVGPMQQLHVLLEFDDDARNEFKRRWHAAVLKDRLARVAVGSSVVLGLLAVAFGYLSLDLRTSGQRRGQLRLVAAAAILLVATGAAIARKVLQL